MNVEELHELWEIQIDILKEFMRICEKYKIQWFAVGGTLLGAVRHKGFIPWDDDIDVGMLADDYYHFCKVAPTEFKEPYYFQYYTSEKFMTPWHAKIRRTDTTGCTEWEAEWMPGDYNKGVFIDVFPFFEIPDEKEEREILSNKVAKLYHVISQYQLCRTPAYLGEHKIRRYLKYLYYSMHISLMGGYNRACDQYIKLCYGSDNGWSTVSQISAFVGNPKLEFDIDIFEDIEKLPFEDFEINVPKKYDKFLRTEFGNYMIPVKGTQFHSGLVVDTKTPYKEYFAKHNEEIRA